MLKTASRLEDQKQPGEDLPNKNTLRDTTKQLKGSSSGPNEVKS